MITLRDLIKSLILFQILGPESNIIFTTISGNLRKIKFRLSNKTGTVAVLIMSSEEKQFKNFGKY